MGEKKKKYPKPKTITFDLQTYNIKQDFNNFKCYRNNKGKYWVGELTPSNTTYKVKIQYREKKSPKVYILEPTILKKAPHRYSDGSLCLYYPYDKDFNSNLSMFSDTIIPWTVEWIYYYELWLDTGVWWGPEAPHNDNIETIKNMKEYS